MKKRIIKKDDESSVSNSTWRLREEPDEDSNVVIENPTPSSLGDWSSHSKL